MCVPATQFELFDNVANLFESMLIAVFDAGSARDDKERRTLKDHDLVGFTNGTELFEAALESLDVGCERVRNGRPRL